MTMMAMRLLQHVRYPDCASDSVPTLPAVTAASVWYDGGAAMSSSSSSMSARVSSATSSAGGDTVSPLGLPGLPALPSVSAATGRGVADPAYAVLAARYMDYIAEFPLLLADTKRYDTQTSLQMLELLRQRMGYLVEFYGLVTFAHTRLLTVDESRQVLGIVTNLDVQLKEFQTLRTSGKVTTGQ
jgi:hypothetical protein